MGARGLSVVLFHCSLGSGLEGLLASYESTEEHAHTTLLGMEKRVLEGPLQCLRVVSVLCRPLGREAMRLAPHWVLSARHPAIRTLQALVPKTPHTCHLRQKDP